MQYSIVDCKTIKDNSDFRIDAEYFRPEFLNSLKVVNSLKHSILSNIGNINGGKRLPLGCGFSEEGIPYIRAEDIKNSFIQYENSPKISLALHKALSRYQTKKEDVLITIVGSVGNVGLVKFNLNNCNLTENCAKITKLSKINSEFLFSFLMSKYGQIQIHREKVGTVQQKLSLDRIRKFIIPIPSEGFQKYISLIVNQANDFLCSSCSFYFQAENILLSSVGLLGYKSESDNFFVKKFSNIQKRNRLDAEYFHPRYEEIDKKIKSCKGGFIKLGNLVKIKKSIEPGSNAYREDGVPFVRVSNLSKLEISNNNQQYISEELFNEVEIYQPKKGEILLSKDATPGLAYYLSFEPKKMIVSGGILRLKTNNDKILPEYLTLVLNSLIVQKQIERDAGGSIINHWRIDQIEDTEIPILSKESQKKIKQLTEKSFNNRIISKSLIEIVKNGIDLAIEKGEEKAKKWMIGEIEKINI